MWRTRWEIWLVWIRSDSGVWFVFLAAATGKWSVAKEMGKDAMALGLWAKLSSPEIWWCWFDEGSRTEGGWMAVRWMVIPMV